MRTGTMEAEISVVEEPQLDILYYPKVRHRKITDEKKETLNVLSLFSGCGGMDLGFEGGFSVLQQSINEELTPHFIDKKLKNGFVQLKKTRSEEHTSELQSRPHLVCRLLLEKKKEILKIHTSFLLQTILFLLIH